MKKELEIARPNVPDLSKPKKMKENLADVEMKDVENTSDETTDPQKDADVLTLEGV